MAISVSDVTGVLKVVSQKWGRKLIIKTEISMTKSA